MDILSVLSSFNKSILVTKPSYNALLSLILKPNCLPISIKIPCIKEIIFSKAV